MSQLIRILYASKYGKTPHTIYAVGNDEQTWLVADAIRLIENKLVTFYTYAKGNVAWVEVHKDGSNKWLQTAADGVPDNNLTNLPDCRVRAA